MRATSLLCSRFLGCHVKGEHCVTSQKTTAKETRIVLMASSKDITFTVAFTLYTYVLYVPILHHRSKTKHRHAKRARVIFW